MPNKAKGDPAHYVGVYVDKDTHSAILRLQSELQVKRGERITLKEAMAEIIKRGLAVKVDA